MVVYTPLAFEPAETSVCVWWGEGTTYGLIHRDDSGQVHIPDPGAPLGGAPPAEVYPLRCVLGREVANRLLAEICTVLNAADQASAPSQTIGALIQTYRRKHGWMLEELPDYYLDDEAVELATYRLAPRLQCAGTDAGTVADVIWAAMPSQTPWAFPEWSDLHFDDAGPALIGWIVDEEIHLQRVFDELCTAGAAHDRLREAVLDSLLPRIDCKAYVRSVVDGLRPRA